MSLVVAAKFDAIQPDPYVTTALGDQTNASMTWSQNEEDQISVPVRVKDRVKSALQMDQPHLVQNVNELPPIEQLSPEIILPPLEWRRTCKILNAHPQYLDKWIAMLKVHIYLIYIHTPPRRQYPPPIYGSRPIRQLTTRFVILLLYLQISVCFQQEITSPYRRTTSYAYEQGSYTKSPYPRQLDVNTFQFPNAHHRKFPVPTSPAVETEQKIWWEKILRTHT